MIRRSATLIDPDGTPAVLVKMPKTGQDTTLDIPTIGRQTLAEASKAGIGCIAVQAGQVLFADSVEAMCEACMDGGITLLGFADQGG
jgi:UDP-2,3-diacylglucosamine hydrolase